MRDTFVRFPIFPAYGRPAKRRRLGESQASVASPSLGARLPLRVVADSVAAPPSTPAVPKPGSQKGPGKKIVQRNALYQRRIPDFARFFRAAERGTIRTSPTTHTTGHAKWSTGSKC